MPAMFYEIVQNFMPFLKIRISVREQNTPTFFLEEVVDKLYLLHRRPVSRRSFARVECVPIERNDCRCYALTRRAVKIIDSQANLSAVYPRYVLDMAHQTATPANLNFYIYYPME